MYYAQRLVALPPAQAEVGRADVSQLLEERPRLAAALASGEYPVQVMTDGGVEVVGLAR